MTTSTGSPDDRAASDPLGVAADLDAGEDDPGAAEAAALPGHGADERAVPADGSTGTGASGPVQEPAVGPPSQDHPR